MPSAINPTWPQSGAASTANVRFNFAAAKSEIEALQTDKAELTAGVPLVLDPYSLSGVFTAAHGLARTPDLYLVFLENKIAQSGYNPGTRLSITSTSELSVGGNATIVGLVTSGVSPSPINISTFLVFNINPNRWKLIATPYLID